MREAQAACPGGDGRTLGNSYPTPFPTAPIRRLRGPPGYKMMEAALACGMQRRLIVAGGSGFLGRALARHFAAHGWDVVIVSRSQPTMPLPARWVRWDGLRQGAWSRELDGAAAVVNLAGRTVNCRYTAQNMLDIYTSLAGLWPLTGGAACCSPCQT